MTANQWNKADFKASVFNTGKHVLVLLAIFIVAYSRTLFIGNFTIKYLSFDSQIGKLNLIYKANEKEVVFSYQHTRPLFSPQHERYWQACLFCVLLIQTMTEC